MLTNNTKRSVHEMALEGDVGAIQTAVDMKPEVVKSRDESGRVPLHWVSRHSSNNEHSSLIIIAGSL